MNQGVQTWLPPVLSMTGALIVVVFTAWLNTRAVLAQMDVFGSQMEAIRNELRAEIRAAAAEIRADVAALRTELHDLARRVERIEEQRGLIERP